MFELSGVRVIKGKMSKKRLEGKLIYLEFNSGGSSYTNFVWSREFELSRVARQN